jgi:hypothetical protein
VKRKNDGGREDVVQEKMYKRRMMISTGIRESKDKEEDVGDKG